MSLSFGTQLIILGIVGVGLLLFAYTELRWVRRNGNRLERRMDMDDAYNSMVTVRTIEGSLRNQGHDTSSAEGLVLRTEMAYERGAYTEAIRLGELAKQALIDSEATPPQPIQESPEVEEVLGAQECMDLPDNLVEARFMMAKAEDLVGSSDVTPEEAQELLESARASMEGGEYADAYCSAVRACKAVETAVADPGKCPGCGADVSDDDRFCRRCGAPLD